MKKTILLIGLLLIPLVYGFTLYDGMIITQQQLDGIDTDTINWQVLNITKTSPVYYEHPFVRINYTGFNIRVNTEDTYLVYIDYRKTGIHYTDILRCLMNPDYNYFDCRDKFIIASRYQAKRLVPEVVYFIEQHQTPVNVSDIIEDWDGEW